MLALALFALAQAWTLGWAAAFSYTNTPISADLVALVLAPSVAWFVWFFLFKMDD